jgi:hypothetical protein
MLYQIKSIMGIGGIYKHSENSMQYIVSSLSDLAVIIEHFDKYPLITQKLADYLLFKMGVDLIKNNEHLTIEGLRKILAIKASMNLGLSNKVKEAFPSIVPIIRPLVINKRVPDSH